MTFFGLTGFLVLSNIITAISSFYLSKDIPFLLTKPVADRDILRLKALETVMNSSWMVLSFIPPVFLAYGVTYHASAAYYFAVSFAFIMLVLLTSGLGISIAHILQGSSRQRGRLVLLGGMLSVSPALFHDEVSHAPDTGRPKILSAPLCPSTQIPLSSPATG
jgi:hypothetical protein